MTTYRCQRCAGELVGGNNRCEYCECIEALRELSVVVTSFAALKTRFRRELNRANHVVRRYDEQYPPL